METTSQEFVVFALVAAILGGWTVKLTRPLWLPSVTRWLLRHGRVKWAMRLRFGKRCH
jgi:hypothetical protein